MEMKFFFWRRSWFDWERDMVVEFERLLEGVAIRRQVEDCWCWVEDSSSMYRCDLLTQYCTT